MREALAKTLKRWFLNSEGEISLTKVGLNIGALGASVLTLPTALAASGVSVAVPPVIVTVSTIAVILGGVLAGTGARDAADKAKK